MILGAGRKTKDDVIDHAVGIVLTKKIGDKVLPNEEVAKIYTNGQNTEKAIEMVKNAYSYSYDEITKNNIILKVVK